MGRWTLKDMGSHEQIEVKDSSFFAGGPERYMMDAHNADCDAYEKRIADLEARCQTETACQIIVKLESDIQTLLSELARVKAESLRVVPVLPGVSKVAHDWYMTPDGLGWNGTDWQSGNGCVETPEGYHAYADCTPVQLKRWEDEE